MLSRLLIAGSIATISIILGLAPSVNFKTSRLSFTSVAYADDISSETIARYAKAAFELEQERRRVYNEILRKTGTPPDFACNDRASLNNLSQQARAIADRFCDNSAKIVHENGLSAETYNKITNRRPNDPNLERRIQQLIDRLAD